MNDTPPLRISLVVIDETEEMRVALQLRAARRILAAASRCSMSFAERPPGLDGGRDAGPRGAAEEGGAGRRKTVRRGQGHLGHRAGGPYPRGRRSEQLLALIEEEPGISILVLAAGAGSEGPGPLVTALVGKMSGRMRVPITIVPGSLTDEQIEALA